MIDSVNAIFASSTIAGINIKGDRVKSIAQTPASAIDQFSDTATISLAASDVVNALQKQNDDDYAQKLANMTSLAAMGTVATQNQVQAIAQTPASSMEQFSDTATISPVASDVVNALQKQNDNDYAQQLADGANLAAAEAVASQNREIISAVYNMASANSFRPRIISKKDLKI